MPPKLNLTPEQIQKKGQSIIKKEEGGGQFRSSSGATIPIGPLVAVGNFSSVSRPKLTTTLKFASGANTLPETWSWRADKIDAEYDTGARLDAKKNITPILNQALCGSCWAFALAACISDCFIVSGKYLQLPASAGSLPTSAVSPTSLLACIRDENCQGCSGGNPGYAAQLIQTKGVFSSTCLDYSFILDNSNFNGNATGHFSSAEEMADAMNNALPNCGCIAPAESRKKFSITDVHTLPSSNAGDTTTPESLRNTWDLARRWIWENGTIVACFVVYDNFMAPSGFGATKGVYFEDYPYDGKGKDIKGMHAVRVVGWGVEKDCPLPAGGTADVPYWMVANSWTEKWGDKGYFKMARYPYNKTAQFDTLIDAGGSQIGGFILFKAGDIVEGAIPQVSSQFQNVVNPERKSAGFYTSELMVTSAPPVEPVSGGGAVEGDKKGESVIAKILGDAESPAAKKSGKKLLVILLLILAFIAAVYYIKTYSPRIFERSEMGGRPYSGSPYGGAYGGGASSGASAGGAFKSFGMHKRFGMHRF